MNWKLTAVFCCGLVAACGGSYERRATAITAVLDCTNDTAEAFGGRHRGECRVELADGRRATAPRPVAVGDYYFDQVWVPDVPR